MLFIVVFDMYIGSIFGKGSKQVDLLQALDSGTNLASKVLCASGSVVSSFNNGICILMFGK